MANEMLRFMGIAQSWFPRPLASWHDHSLERLLLDAHRTSDRFGLRRSKLDAVKHHKVQPFVELGHTWSSTTE